MRFLFSSCLVVSLILLPLAGRGAEPTISTVAGTGKPENNGDKGPALEVNIGDPFGVEFGPDGALYICEVRHHRIRRLDPKTGELTTIAGTGEKGYAGDGGPATKAKLNEPYEIRFDGEGNLYFVEMQNHVVRRIDAKTGVISTIAGTGEAGYGGDGGPATKAQMRSPHSIALDGRGKLYVADILNHRVRVVDLKSGTIDSLAGNGEKKLPEAGRPAKNNPVLGPRALYILGDTLWLALREGHSVWKLDLSQGEKAAWVHVAGTGQRGYTGDGGPAAQATMDGPKGIVVTKDGIIDIVDTENQAIRRITPDGVIHTLAGMGPKHQGDGGDGGPATKARLARPHGICYGPDGDVYIGDTLNHKVRRVHFAK